MKLCRLAPASVTGDVDRKDLEDRLPSAALGRSDAASNKDGESDVHEGDGKIIMLPAAAGSYKAHVRPCKCENSGIG